MRLVVTRCSERAIYQSAVMNTAALIRGMKGILIFSIVLMVGFSLYNPVIVMKKKLTFLSYFDEFVWRSKVPPATINSRNLTAVEVLSGQPRAEPTPQPCHPNPAFNSLTSKLKPIYKDFMMYRHCRNFPLLRKASSCDREGTFLLLAVKSLAEHADRRASIRSTWGQERVVEGALVRRVFLLGLTERQIRSQAVQALVDHESKQYNDIIQWGFRESFFNVTLKETLFWQWFSQDCRAVKFVFKGDDDVFVNVENVVDFLKDHNPSQDLYVGDVFRNWYPSRAEHSKYYIPLFLYGNKPYPPYAGGGGYLLSGTSILKLHKAAEFEELFPIDDAFVGICAQKANIDAIPHRGFRTYGDIPFDPCVYQGLMVVHRVMPNELWLIWSLLKMSTKPCSRFTRFSVKP
ncbi:N-acetyllactosaminide beta-1,3-N-acetylglucosaminyltransferase 4-like [Stegostoma tigrinum]|uniref:N-acetyllactosaminide beta-1,3-N-acetylglucosaminyltransferase 4-like n=1 Tax=Stegostoma tigrinum TaxID=3053191 RepID=UPI00202B7159|nr:N-acetyllactosaminide beta-1,3-N-acetylglucosaminyltransferase 4-like [Stegostoma tigrinum]